MSHEANRIATQYAASGMIPRCATEIDAMVERENMRLREEIRKTIRFLEKAHIAGFVDGGPVYHRIETSEMRDRIDQLVAAIEGS